MKNIISWFLSFFNKESITKEEYEIIKQKRLELLPYYWKFKNNKNL
jgi:hypothetical protein